MHPQLLPSCLLAAKAADQERIGGQEPAYPRRCARDQTSAHSPCCSTATPWLRQTRGVLHSNKNPVNLIPSVSPRFPAQALRGDFACLWGQLEEAAGNRRAGQRWTWQLVGPALSPEAYFCPAPCSSTRRRPAEGTHAAGCPGVGRGLPAPASQGICSTTVLVLGSVEPQLLSSCWESSRFIYYPEKGLKVYCKGKEETSQGPRAKCAHGTRGPEQGMCPDIPDPHQGLVQPRDEICPRQLSLLPPSPQKCAK